MFRQFLPCPFSSLLKGKYISNIVINSHLYQRDCGIWLHLRINLHLNECPELNSLPENIQHLTSLRSLCIWDCEGLASLPINQFGYLTSLSHLEIGYCPQQPRLVDNPKLFKIEEEVKEKGRRGLAQDSSHPSLWNILELKGTLSLSIQYIYILEIHI